MVMSSRERLGKRSNKVEEEADHKKRRAGLSEEQNGKEKEKN